MGNDSFGNDPRTIWQNQPTEPSAMTLEKIRQKTQELHRKMRRQLLGNMILPLIIVAFYGFGITRFHGFDPVLQPLFAFVIAWSLAGLYFLNRGMWPRAMPGDAASSTGIESYRHEIELRRAYYGRILLWSFGPGLLALGVLIFSTVKAGILDRGTFPKAMPFLTLVVVWIVGYFVMRMREQRDLRREIAELNDIERADR